MTIAFYAPMKAPDHPVPSGDRALGRLLVRALEATGEPVEIACRLRTWDRTGDSVRQQRLADLGARAARCLLARPRARSWRLWFTYHLYHRAPDPIGPVVASALGIPYVVAEASVAAKQARGPFASGHASTIAALGTAARVIAVNPVDVEGVRAVLPDPSRLGLLPPFLDLANRPVTPITPPAEGPWLLAVGMFRARAKLASYQVLGDALARLLDRRWRLAVIGAGPAEREVRHALSALGARVWFLGQQPDAIVAGWMAAADLLVWPAIDEAFGMAVLEAQAAGLPVVAGASPGVGAVVRTGETALLPPLGDAAAFAEAVAWFLDQPDLRRAFGARAAAWVRSERDLPTAAARLAALLP
ncbi:MAG: glycosyltransferase [Alphaproteobacteria bacterium]|nr:MAG: glycosyltransferase [Alphaproteobacteria bacterium]